MYIAFTVFVRHTDLHKLYELVGNCAVEFVEMSVLLDDSSLLLSVSDTFLASGYDNTDAVERTFLPSADLPSS